MSIVYDFAAIALAMNAPAEKLAPEVGKGTCTFDAVLGRSVSRQAIEGMPPVGYVSNSENLVLRRQYQNAVGVWNGPPPSMLNDMARQYMASQAQASSQLQSIGLRQQLNDGGLNWEMGRS